MLFCLHQLGTLLGMARRRRHWHVRAAAATAADSEPRRPFSTGSFKFPPAVARGRQWPGAAAGGHGHGARVPVPVAVTAGGRGQWDMGPSRGRRGPGTRRRRQPPPVMPWRPRPAGPPVFSGDRTRCGPARCGPKKRGPTPRGIPYARPDTVQCWYGFRWMKMHVGCLGRNAHFLTIWMTPSSASG